MAPWISYMVLALGAWGIIAPAATYYGTQWKTQVEERAACEIRITNAVHAVAKEVNEAADRAINAAHEAALHVPPTPTTPAELVTLCASDVHCRERSQ